MKNTAKLIVISIFALGALSMFLSSNVLSMIGEAAFSDAVFEPTPPKSKKKTPTSTPTATNTPTATATNTPVATTSANTASNTSTTSTSTAGGKKIQKLFILGSDSLSEEGEAPFDHENHAEKNYSPDGKSVVACIECHHTDQPKPQPPLFTSERAEILTMAVYQKSSQKVSGCRDCHFQDGNVPEGKTMPTANKKDLNNELAYHINCNTCHDAAFKLRGDLKTKSKTFATSKDCKVCHKVN